MVQYSHVVILRIRVRIHLHCIDDFIRYANGFVRNVEHDDDDVVDLVRHSAEGGSSWT